MALGRGNREGNNAFVYDFKETDDRYYDIGESERWKHIKLLEIETDP